VRHKQSDIELSGEALGLTTMTANAMENICRICPMLLKTLLDSQGM